MKIRFLGSNTMGEKGQVVVPVEGRQVLGLESGDKLIFLGDIDNGVLIVATPEVFEKHMEQMHTGFESLRQQIVGSDE